MASEIFPGVRSAVLCVEQAIDDLEHAARGSEGMRSDLALLWAQYLRDYVGVLRTSALMQGMEVQGVG